MDIINLRLMSHPLNWITLAMWLLIIGIVAHAAGWSKGPAQKPNSSGDSNSGSSVTVASPSPEDPQSTVLT